MVHIDRTIFSSFVLFWCPPDVSVRECVLSARCDTATTTTTSRYHPYFIYAARIHSLNKMAWQMIIIDHQPLASALASLPRSKQKSERHSYVCIVVAVSFFFKLKESRSLAANLGKMKLMRILWKSPRLFFLFKFFIGAGSEECNLPFSHFLRFYYLLMKPK